MSPHSFQLPALVILYQAVPALLQLCASMTASPCCRVSGPQGSIRPFTTAQDPSAWKAADWKKNQDWVYRLTPADIAELDSAVAAAVDQGIRKEVCCC